MPAFIQEKDFADGINRLRKYCEHSGKTTSPHSPLPGRAMLLFFTFVFLFLLLSQFLFGYLGLVVCSVLSFLLSLFICFYQKRYGLLRQLKAKLLRGEDPWELASWVPFYAGKVKLPVPRIYIVPSSKVLALALNEDSRPLLSYTRIFFKRARLATRSTTQLVLSEGLLKRLEEDEVRCVICCLLCQAQDLEKKRWKANLFRLQQFCYRFAGFLDRFFWPPYWYARKYRKKAFRGFHPFYHFFSCLLCGLSWFPLRWFYRRKHYLQQDKEAAKLLGKEDPLAEFLWKMSYFYQCEPLPFPPWQSHLFMVNPLTEKGSSRYFKVHPSVEKRIENLVGHYPL